MIGRIAKALPLALVLGCGASSSPPPAESPPASGEGPTAAQPAAAAPSAPSATATPAAPPITADPTKKKDEAAAQPAKASTGDASISTKISQDEIMALVNKNGELFNRCYNLGAGTSKSYKAKVTVKATVSPVGSVNEVLIVTSTAKNPKVDACVTDAFKKLNFNRPAGSGATVFTFPLSFDGIEQVQ